MLIGSYPGNLNNKRRVAVPKKFINELGAKIILAKWYEGCLVLVSSKVWGQLLSRLTGGAKVLGLTVRDIERFTLGSAFELEPDNQGRVVIPEILVSYAGIKENLIFIGLIDRVEIWPREVWDEKSSELAKVTKEYIEELVKNAQKRTFERSS
jgi:MraZ protein